MVSGISLAAWLGVLTFLSLFTTVSLGIAYHRFHKPVFRFHRFFAFLTITLAIIHAVLVFLMLVYGIAL